jgi:hypothetical protein
MDNRYNGWTNYTTWRVNLEVFDTLGDDLKYMGWHKLDKYNLADAIKEYANELIEQDTKEGLALDYARAFLSDVNWWEIAKHLKENYSDEDEDEGVLEHAAWYDTSAELE